MKLLIYGLKDNVPGEFIFFFQAQNEGMMKRMVKSSLMTKEQNAFTHNIKDKSIYELGEIETVTGDIKPEPAIFICGVNEIRLELIKEIKVLKQEAGEEKPDANEVCDDE